MFNLSSDTFPDIMTVLNIMPFTRFITAFDCDSGVHCRVKIIINLDSLWPTKENMLST